MLNKYTNLIGTLDFTDEEGITEAVVEELFNGDGIVEVIEILIAGRMNIAISKSQARKIRKDLNNMFKDKKHMMEEEMEDFLQKEGYVITVGEKGEGVIDSTLVSEFAVALGYDVKMNSGDINEFTLNKWCEWCGEDFEKSEIEESRLGNICFICKKAVKSRGETI